MPETTVGYNSIVSFPDKRIVNVEENAVTSTDLKLLEDVLSVVLGDVDGRPIGSTEEVILGAVGFRVRFGMRNPTGESTDRPLPFGKNQHAHDVTAVGEGTQTSGELVQTTVEDK